MAWTEPSLQAEYDAATRGAGVIRLEGWSTVRVRGRDRVTFLHNMCTNDIRGLAPWGQCEAFVTDVKGKIVGHVIVFAEDEQLTLLAVPHQAPQLIAHLERYIVREDVYLADDTSNLHWAIQVGPEAAATSPVGNDESSTQGVFTAACPQLWPNARLTSSPTAGELDRLKGIRCSEDVWHTLRIESGWPLFGVDFDASSLPQEIARDSRAISFRKGCYLGQETIARIDALGHVNRKLVTLQLATDEPLALPAEALAEGKPAGRVTSTCWSPGRGGALAFATIRRGCDEPGTAFECQGRRAVVIETPAMKG